MLSAAPPSPDLPPPAPHHLVAGVPYMLAEPVYMKVPYIPGTYTGYMVPATHIPHICPWAGPSNSARASTFSQESSTEAATQFPRMQVPESHPSSPGGRQAEACATVPRKAYGLSPCSFLYSFINSENKCLFTTYCGQVQAHMWVKKTLSIKHQKAQQFCASPGNISSQDTRPSCHTAQGGPVFSALQKV